MIKGTDPNPLDVLEVKQAKFLPPHFETVNIPLKYNLEKGLANWLHKHIKNRFFIGKNVSLDNENKIVHVCTVGFEENKDMSYFMLACPHLKYN